MLVLKCLFGSICSTAVLTYDVLGDAHVVVNILLFMWQLVRGWEVGNGVPGGEQRQQIWWQELGHF